MNREQWNRSREESKGQPQPTDNDLGIVPEGKPTVSMRSAGGNRTWLLQKQYEEVNTNFRTSWDIYIKFYTVFLTFNVAALAALFSTRFSLASSSEWLVIGAFVLQDLLCAATSARMAGFSRRSGEQLEQARAELLRYDMEEEKRIPDSSLPVDLGRWAGWANCGAMLAMVALWLGAGLAE